MEPERLLRASQKLANEPYSERAHWSPDVDDNYGYFEYALAGSQQADRVINHCSWRQAKNPTPSTTVSSKRRLMYSLKYYIYFLVWTEYPNGAQSFLII
jgi:hypothetical protein